MVVDSPPIHLEIANHALGTAQCRIHIAWIDNDRLERRKHQNGFALDACSEQLQGFRNMQVIG